jgi:hypothetical protein
MVPRWLSESRRPAEPRMIGNLFLAMLHDSSRIAREFETRPAHCNWCSYATSITWRAFESARLTELKQMLECRKLVPLTVS